MYSSDIVRSKVANDWKGSSEEFLASLEMVFTIAPCTEDDLQQVEELTVCTHQLSTTGYIYSYEELRAFCHSTRHKLWIVRLSDKYGSYGKIGLILIECNAYIWSIKLLLMSCRVISRGVGTILINHIMNMAQIARVRLRAEFIINNRNRMMPVAYKWVGFKEIKRDGEHVVFENDLSSIQPSPSYIRIYTLV